MAISMIRVDTNEGSKNYVTAVPQEIVLEKGLPGNAIIGEVTQPLEVGEVITPKNFARNKAFVEFMHSVIARRGPALRGFSQEARRIGNGNVFVIDQRTPSPQGAVPPEDIVGVFQIKNGEFVPGSYQANPNHLILSANGFFNLGSELEPCLEEELVALTNGAE